MVARTRGPGRTGATALIAVSTSAGTCSVSSVTTAERSATTIAAALDHVGVMAVEMFELPDGTLLVNEIAPRTHNSGHYTYGACATSQFEQHVRAVCGLPLGDPRQLTGAVMVNLIGDLWADGDPRWHHVLARPHARLHLYGKLSPARGRKMGHVLLLDDDPDRALARSSTQIALPSNVTRACWRDMRGSSLRIAQSAARPMIAGCGPSSYVRSTPSTSQ